MTLSSDVLVIGFGALLLFTGILGGGFEIKDLKISKVPAVPRIMAGAAGGVIMFLGIGMWAASQPGQNSNFNASAVSAPSPTPAPTSADVSYKVSDTLTEGGMTEQVVVTIDGHPTTLNVSLDYPTQETDLTSRRGLSSYTIDSRTNFPDGTTLSLSGQGTVEVAEARIYDVEIHGSGDQYSLVLVER